MKKIQSALNNQHAHGRQLGAQQGQGRGQGIDHRMQHHTVFQQQGNGPGETNEQGR